MLAQPRQARKRSRAGQRHFAPVIPDGAPPRCARIQRPRTTPRQRCCTHATAMTTVPRPGHARGGPRPAAARSEREHPNSEDGRASGYLEQSRPNPVPGALTAGREPSPGERPVGAALASGDLRALLGRTAGGESTCPDTLCRGHRAAVWTNLHRRRSTMLVPRGIHAPAAAPLSTRGGSFARPGRSKARLDPPEHRPARVCPHLRPHGWKAPTTSDSWPSLASSHCASCALRWSPSEQHATSALILIPITEFFSALTRGFSWIFARWEAARGVADAASSATCLGVGTFCGARLRTKLLKNWQVFHLRHASRRRIARLWGEAKEAKEGCKPVSSHRKTLYEPL